MINTQTRVTVALHQAKSAIRNPKSAIRHLHLMNTMIEEADYPRLVTAEVARRLGRERAMQVNLSTQAIGTPKLFAGQL